jgi:exosortase/archaeosortase family protein
VTVAGAGSVSARPRLLVPHLELAVAFSLLPVVRIWDLTDDINTALTTAALFAGAGLLIWRISARHPPGSSRAARIAAFALLGACAWQLAWIDSNDFWFYRVALVAWAAAWLLLWWGWSGFRRGWRVLLAFALWAGACDGPSRWMRDSLQQGARFAPWVAAATARGAAAVLGLLGHPASTRGHDLFVFGETVSVGLTCTSLPLTKLLLLLLVLAALLLRLPWRRTAALAAAVVVIAFATAVIRVALLAAVAHDAERFHYWHEPGSGGQWFTAAAMLAAAALFFLALPVRVPPPAPSGGADAPHAGRPIAIAAVLFLAAARLTTPAPPPAHFIGLPPAGFSVQSDAAEALDLGPAGGAHANMPAWLRRITLRAGATGARMELTVAYVPQMLAGDLRPEPGFWALDAGGRFAVLRSPGREVWVSTIAPDGYAVATDSGWDRKVDEGLDHPARWLQWLAHRRPLRDKRAYWAEAIWTGPAGREPATAPAPFSHWIGLTAPAPDAGAVPPL